MGSRELMKWAGYALALVIGVVALVSGIASGKGVIAGAGAGWLIDSVILIVKRQSATVTASAEPDLSLFAMFDNLPAWLWGVSVAILVVGALVGYFIKH